MPEIEESSLVEDDNLLPRKVALYSFNPLEITQIKNKNNSLLEELKQHISCVSF